MKQVCKAQKLSMLNARVDHKCKFAIEVIENFMKYDWDNKEYWEKSPMDW